MRIFGLIIVLEKRWYKDKTHLLFQQLITIARLKGKLELYKRGYEECINILDPEQQRIIHKTVDEIKSITS